MTTKLRILLDQNTPADQRDDLLEILREAGELHDEEERRGPLWDTLVLVMSDVTVIAGGAAAMVKLANEINAWRKANSGTKTKLECTDQPALELATATDQQVLEYLVRCNEQA